MGVQWYEGQSEPYPAKLVADTEPELDSILIGVARGPVTTYAALSSDAARELMYQLREWLSARGELDGFAQHYPREAAAVAAIGAKRLVGQMVSRGMKWEAEEACVSGTRYHELQRDDHGNECCTSCPFVIPAGHA